MHFDRQDVLPLDQPRRINGELVESRLGGAADGGRGVGVVIDRARRHVHLRFAGKFMPVEVNEGAVVANQTEC